MAEAAEKNAKSTKKTTKSTSKATQTTSKSTAPQVQKDINPAASWPFPVYTKS